MRGEIYGMAKQFGARTDCVLSFWFRTSVVLVPNCFASLPVSVSDKCFVKLEWKKIVFRCIFNGLFHVLF
jgi:hypothetical protein